MPCEASREYRRFGKAVCDTNRAGYWNNLFRLRTDAYLRRQPGMLKAGEDKQGRNACRSHGIDASLRRYDAKVKDMAPCLPLVIPLTSGRRDLSRSGIPQQWT